jgi:hypothetical protein
VVLLGYVIEIFNFSDLNLLFFWNIHVKMVKRCFVASTFINSDFSWPSIFLESLPKEGFFSYGISFGAEQEINRVTLFIDSSIKINPFAIQLDVRLIHPPASIDRLLALTETLVNKANKAFYPSL